MGIGGSGSGLLGGGGVWAVSRRTCSSKVMHRRWVWHLCLVLDFGREWILRVLVARKEETLGSSSLANWFFYLLLLLLFFVYSILLIFSFPFVHFFRFRSFYDIRPGSLSFRSIYLLYGWLESLSLGFASLLGLGL